MFSIDQSKVGIVIPARYQSSRLPGKPLIDLCGTSMLQRTWERCIAAFPKEQVYIATDNLEIKQHVECFGGIAIMTSSDCLTGTDRLAEANTTLDLDLVINVQGDEPIIDPQEIKDVINFALDNPGCVVNAIAEIYDKSEFYSLTIPKVVKRLDNDLLYMSRAPIPGSKSGEFYLGYKQICIYAFPKKSLVDFSRYSSKTPLEDVEDIEILRFLEMGYSVKLIPVSGKSMAVDTMDDVHKVRKIIQNIRI